MSEEQFEPLEKRLREEARTFPYPTTPDLRRAVGERLARRTASATGLRVVIAVVIVALLLAALLAVPQVRASIIDILRLGAVRIVLVPPTSTPPARPPTALPGVGLTPVPVETLTPPATPLPSPTPLATVLDLAGETTLAAARSQVQYPIRLPTYPSDLGPPDRVYLQDVSEPAVVLVWLDKMHPGRVRLSLQMLGPGMFVEKIQPVALQQTTVNGLPAVWAQGPYLMRQRNGDINIQRLIEGQVLIWQEGKLTYRLETDLSMQEAVKIAESLR